MRAQTEFGHENVEIQSSIPLSPKLLFGAEVVRETQFPVNGRSQTEFGNERMQKIERFEVSLTAAAGTICGVRI